MPNDFFKIQNRLSVFETGKTKKKWRLFCTDLSFEETIKTKQKRVKAYHTLTSRHVNISSSKWIKSRENTITKSVTFPKENRASKLKDVLACKTCIDQYMYDVTTMT